MTKKTNYNIIALIVAAGNGERFGNNIPKQYLPLSGKPLLSHSVETFLSHPQIDATIVVYNQAHIEYYTKYLKDLPLLPPVNGGRTRQESVFLGLKSLITYNPKKVLIHDAARPLLDSRVISDTINALSTKNAAIPVIQLEDTIKTVEYGKIQNTIPRDNLFSVQTPQGFDYNTILKAHTKADKLSQKQKLLFTDDASILEFFGENIVAVKGSKDNFKITTESDLKKAKLIMDNIFETRVGIGFDAHKFCAAKYLNDNYITLCGVKVPHEKSLEGHSDADVALHAVVDAILGSIAAGDIGLHFSPNDMKWKDADSSIFLSHASQLLIAQNAEIINIDLTIICEKPKILTHRDKMCDTIARILNLEKSRVSVKATTTEGMGFTGRGEGVAAQAVVSIKCKKIS